MSVWRLTIVDGDVVVTVDRVVIPNTIIISSTNIILSPPSEIKSLHSRRVVQSLLEQSIITSPNLHLSPIGSTPGPEIETIVLTGEFDGGLAGSVEGPLLEVSVFVSTLLAEQTSGGTRIAEERWGKRVVGRERGR